MMNPAILDCVFVWDCPLHFLKDQAGDINPVLV